jgi:hypothetical protein
MDELQKLELVDRLFPALFTGEKVSTLRWREGEVAEGYLLYCASNNPKWKALVWVTGTEKKPLRAFASFCNQTPDELLAAMRTHYPEITLEDDVLLVHHLTPYDTAERKGIPDELWGEVILSAEGLKESS